MAMFVPLGIPTYKGKAEEGKIKFTLNIELDDADKMLVQIRDGAESIYEEEITDPKMLTQGSHDWYWDGFDKNGILDTAFLTKAHLNLLMRVWKDDETEFSTIDFNAEYDEVHWVDIKINKNEKRIDVTLRVNLKDGGARGVECTEQIVAPDPIIIKECPWDKIPKEALSYYGKSPIKKRTKSFEDLKQLSIEGVNKYWSRHKGNIGKGVNINGELYEVFINAVNETNSEISLDDVPLIYNTNQPWARSGNPGGSYADNNWDDEAISLMPDGIVQRIAYNVGYIEFSNGWGYRKTLDETLEFEFTSAHELGHEIIQAFAGTTFSWQHKGSSYYFPQSKKPIGKESFKEENFNIDFMEHTKGEEYPKLGEIDLMKYYNNDPIVYDYSRIIANEKDVLGLIWLTKLKLK